MGIFAVLFWYLLGGLTFIPLVVVAIAFVVIQRADHQSASGIEKDDLEEPLLDGKPVDEVTVHSLLEQEVDTGVDAHMSAWLTVTREFVDYAALSNKKTKSITADASVSLYRQIMGGGNKAATNSNGGSVGEPASNDLSRSASHNNSAKPVIPKHKYFAVLRHGNLFLYEDSEQLRIRQVIVLANHEVSIYPPNLPESELFLKRNSICISKKGLSQLQLGKPFPPDTYFLFSDVCPEKEDLYFALIRASKQKKVLSKNISATDPITNAVPLLFDENDMMNLIQLLHSSDANLQSRWLNAIIGRLFLSLHKTKMMQDYVRGKIERKLARIKTPNFLDDIKLNQIYCGDSAPTFTNPRLKELTKDGLLEVEVDVSYAGNFRAEVTTKASLQLGSRFKPREVNLLLSVALTRLSGTLLIKIKPPPSDRVWYCFSTMPHISMIIEPVVSSRQITYSMITRVIENRIRDAVKEVLVYPNMDDLCFFDTFGNTYRGGIWDTTLQKALEQISNPSHHNHHGHFMEGEDTAQPATAAYSPATASGNLEGSATLRHRTSIQTTKSASHSEALNGESSPDLPAFLNSAMQAVDDENNQPSMENKSISSDSRKHHSHQRSGSHKSQSSSPRSSSGPSSSSGLPINGSSAVHKTDEYKALGFGYTPPEFMARSSTKSDKSRNNTSSLTSTATSAVKKWSSRYFRKQQDKTNQTSTAVPTPKFNDSGKLSNSNKIHTHPLDGTQELENEDTMTTTDDGPSIFDNSTKPSSIRRFSPYTGGANGDPYGPAADMTVPSTMGNPRPPNVKEPSNDASVKDTNKKEEDKKEEEDSKITAEYERLPTDDEDNANSNSEESDDEQQQQPSQEIPHQEEEHLRRKSIVKRRPVSDTYADAVETPSKEEEQEEEEEQKEQGKKEQENEPDSGLSTTPPIPKEAPPLPPRTITTSSFSSIAGKSDIDGEDTTEKEKGKEFMTFPPPIPRTRAVPPTHNMVEFISPPGPPPPLPRRESGGPQQSSNSISVAAAAAAYNPSRRTVAATNGSENNDDEEKNPTILPAGLPPPIPPRTLGRTASVNVHRQPETATMVPPPRAVRRKPVGADSKSSPRPDDDDDDEEHQQHQHHQQQQQHTWMMPQEPAPMHIHHPKSPSERGPDTAAATATTTTTDRNQSSSTSSPYNTSNNGGGQEYEWENNDFHLPEELERLGATMG